ncbi:MAG TPA: SDR family oxidoreductase [Solirubrobacterales bacterium]|jgi:NAD(P)-dependent dehydrogenase (short-subunit alcohol dehydrogenase family)|nr:SDR family oxidoreductase [Solirubrobacterales bacterium]
MGELDGRVIAVAGVGGGLGPAVVERFAAEGATLALADIAVDRIETAVEPFGIPADRLDMQAVDLLDVEAAATWCASLEERFGRVDGLLHLVGGWRGGDPIESFDLADYDWLHDLLVRTLQNATRAFHGALTAGEHGRFAIVSSAQAQAPEGTNAAYAATKAAAESWTLALADSFAGSKATANVVVVNAILTKGMRERNPDKEYPSFTPAEEIADALLYLCSDAAGRMNGQRLELHP